jgi:hypothetical protein
MRGMIGAFVIGLIVGLLLAYYVLPMLGMAPV